MHKTNLSQVILDAEDAGLLQSFELYMRSENFSPNTIRLRLTSLRKFIAFCQDEHLPLLRNVSREHVELWMQDTHARLRPYSVLSYTQSLRAFYSWLVEEDELRASPMARIRDPKVDEVAKDVVAPADLRKAFAMLEKQKRWRDAAILAILYDTGLRASELAAIRVDEVNLLEGTITLPKTKPRRIRTLPISPKAVRYIDRYLRTPRVQPDILINGTQGQMGRHSIWRITRKIFAEIGIKAIIGAHDMRHTSATHVVDEMTESTMMAIYGWKDAKMARHYAQQGLQQAAIAAHRKASPLERLYRK